MSERGRRVRTKIGIAIWRFFGIGFAGLGLLWIVALFLAPVLCGIAPSGGGELLISTGGILVGSWCLRRARRLQAPSAEALLAADPRPPVLLLRPFLADQSMARARALGGFRFRLWVESSEEEQLRDALEDFGPLVAIGSPGERIPHVGAARTYASSEEWQQRVLEFMSTASLVILRLGESEGLLWELRAARSRMDPGKLVLSIPQKLKQYEELVKRMEPDLPVRLPTYRVKKSLVLRRALAAGSVRGFVHFDEQWTAHFVEVQTLSFLRRPLWNSLRPCFHLMLRPVYEKLGVVWAPLSIAWSPVILMAAFGAYFALGFWLF